MGGPGCLWRWVLGCWLIGSAPAAWGAAGPSTNESRVINGFAAIVNNKVITYDEVELAVRETDIKLAQTQLARQQFSRQQFSAEMDRLRSEALNGLIERELILYEFETAGYKLPESAIEDQLRDRIRQSFGGDRARMIRTLNAQGMSFESFRRRLRDDLIVQLMTIKNVSSSVMVSPYKVEQFYKSNPAMFAVEDQVKLRMIFLAVKPDRDAAATRQLADELLQKIKDGASFADLASTYSDGSQRKAGGDWGEVDRKTLREDLAQVAFSLKAGEVSGVLEKPDGCYIMKVEQVIPAHTRPLTDPNVRGQIEDTLARKERARLREEWISRLRAKSYIRIFPWPRQ